ncbi:MAG: alkaline phosphatase PhoX [Stackebrandtia sp.]
MSESALPKSRLGRRAVMGGTLAALVGTTALGGLVVRQARAEDGEEQPEAGKGDGGYGELKPVTRKDPETGHEQTLLLPEGFDFTLLSLAGTELADGAVTPLAHDGTCAFPGPDDRTVRLVRNHEDRNESDSTHPSGPDPDKRYDGKGGGGTTTVQVRIGDDGVPALDKAWTSLSGTIVNCAGGPTPSGSWLSCEETTAGPDAGWEQPHGYIFEVPSTAEESVDPVPLKAMGRFVHEAIAVDPSTGYVYETEDQDTAGLYRFIPEDADDLAAGGKLQMLKVVGEDKYDTRTGQEVGAELPVEWVDIADPDPENAEADALAVYKQGVDQGAATFARLEGAITHEDAVYISSTSGGDVEQGQIWELRPAEGDDGVLRLLYESPDQETLSFPDNVTVSPKGALLICEDTDREYASLQGLTMDGEIFPFCTDEGGGEWTGCTFSPDGKYLFANLQGSTDGDPSKPADPGRTLAFWGPWENGDF